MKRRIQILLLLLVIFGAGLATGWFLRPASMIEDASRRNRWKSGDPSERVEAFMEEFQKEIALSHEQAALVRPLIESFMEKSKRYQREQLRLKKAAHDETVESIRELLTSDQQQTLESLNASSNKRFQRALDGSEE